MTDPLVGVSLADALDLYLSHDNNSQQDAALVLDWFRANRDTLTHGKHDIARFDALLDAATKIGQP